MRESPAYLRFELARTHERIAAAEEQLAKEDQALQKENSHVEHLRARLEELQIEEDRVRLDLAAAQRPRSKTHQARDRVATRLRLLTKRAGELQGRLDALERRT